MAFSSTIIRKTLTSNLRKHIGTYTNASGSTGGDIQTGLTRVDICLLQPTGSSMPSSQHVVNETLPLSGGGVTIVTGSNESGSWEATGK